MKPCRAIAILGAFSLLICVPSRGQNLNLVIVGGTLIDGTGSDPRPNAVVVIEGARIKAVGSKGSVSYPPNARIIPADGKTILPGLIDSHIHFLDFMPQLFLHFGVTTVYDTANPTEWILAQREAINHGKIKGPRMFVTGLVIDGDPAQSDPNHASERGGYRVHVKTTEEAKTTVRNLVRQGVDAIKVHEGLTPELLQAVVEEAHRLGIEVVGHSYNAREAALAGLKFIEHTAPIARATLGDSAGLQQGAEGGEPVLESLMEPRLFDPLISLLVKQGAYFNPTITRSWITVLPKENEWSQQVGKLLADPSMAFIPEGRRQAWLRMAAAGAKRADSERRKDRIEALRKVQELTRRYAQAGGKVVAGTDAGPSSGPTNLAGLALHIEMEAFVDAGLTPMQAILGSTLWPAQLLHKEKELGTIEAGKLADLILVDGDPLQDIRATRKLHLVIKDGQVVDTALDPKFLNPLPRPTYADDPLGYRGPEIASITPKVVRQGDPAVTLEVTGKRFSRQSVVRLDNAELPTQFASVTKLTATVGSSALQQPGSYAVTVVTPGSGGATSNVLYLVVNFKY